MTTILVCVTPRVEEPWVPHAAAQLAEEMGARVVVLSVEEVESQRFEPLPRKATRASARDAAERADARLREAGVEPADVLVRSGRPVETVLEVAEEVDADMILVGSSPRRPIAQKLLGSVALELVQRSPRNVMVISEPRALRRTGRRARPPPPASPRSWPSAGRRSPPACGARCRPAGCRSPGWGPGPGPPAAG